MIDHVTLNVTVMDDRTADPVRDGMSERQLEVLGLIASGLSNPQVAERMFLSINMVTTYIRETYRKIGAQNRSQAITWAIDHEIVPARPRVDG